MSRKKYFISIITQVEHAVDDVTGRGEFSFKTKIIFVTENNL